MNAELEQRLLDLLRAHPQGLSEYDILRHLQRSEQAGFDEALFKDNLAMYRAHFLLFHALYRLRAKLVAEKRSLLDIHVLKIRLLPWSDSGQQELSKVDPMPDYYLHLDNLRDTTADDVEKLLGGFWAKYLANERRTEALAVLGLEEPATDRQIEARYRRLAMRLHPDRGGDTRQFQALREAVAILRR